MSDPFFKPVSGFDLPRFAGVPTFMRLPHVPLEAPKIKEVDIGIIGVPWDSGTTNRPGPRHGPRQLRDASTMIRAQHPVSAVRPYEKLNCADLGDVSINPADIEDSMNRITSFYKKVSELGIKPLTAGGDHLTSLPVLRAVADKGPLGMIHFDSHTDLFHSYFDGTMFTHGTPFRRAIEENLIDPKKYVILGLRGGLYDPDDLTWAIDQGITIISTDKFYEIGINETIKIIKDILADTPTRINRSNNSLIMFCFLKKDSITCH